MKVIVRAGPVPLVWESEVLRKAQTPAVTAFDAGSFVQYALKAALEDAVCGRRRAMESTTMRTAGPIFNVSSTTKGRRRCFCE